MVGFTRLQVSGYRRLRNLDLALGPMNVLIGANGAGKSSVLEVVRLLGQSAQGRLQESLSQSGGIQAVVAQDGRTNVIGLGVEIPVSGETPIAYRLELGIAGFGYQLRTEHLSYQNPPPLSGRSQVLSAARGNPWSATETVLSQLPVEGKAKDCRDMLRRCGSIYHALDISRRAPVRQPQPMQPADTPADDGSLLLACLYNMRELQRARFDAVEDALRAAFPAFESIALPVVAAGTVTLAWKDRTLTAPLYPHQLSEGTLRFLWLATLLQSPGLPPVTLIDEPEVSLHPEMLRLLVELMREASARTQLIVATHSDRLVRFLTPDELVVCDLAEDGGMAATRGDTLDLDEWLKDYTLDQLWSMGQIGGRS